MALSTLEEVLLRERNSLKLLILRETNRLCLGKKPVNFKIANFVRKYKQDKDVWGKFLDSINAEDLSRNLNVYEWKFVTSEEKSIIRRYLRLNSASRDVLKKFQVSLWDSRMSGGPQVRVAQGELLGRAATTPSGKSYFSFQGIPYAQPPIGSLRFKAPEYPNPWTGVRDATSQGTICAQMDPYQPKKFKGSEDSLHLNVHTPKLPENGSSDFRTPVIVFVHGGRYLVGNGGYYRPDYLIENDVIVVTVNYRLGIFGFLALNIPEVPGNAALKDVIFALRWIKENISKFNGDPNNVTVFGESAGAGTVSSLLVSPMADGLFHKMILESGSYVHDIFMTKEDTVAKAKHVAKLLGKDLSDPKELLEYLQTVPAKQLADIVCDVMRAKIDPKAYFSPVVENVFEGVEAFFPQDPILCLKEGRHKKVPMIVGYNSHEGALFLMRNQKGDIVYDKNLGNFIPRAFYADRNSEKVKHFAAEVKRFYFGEKEIGELTKKKYVDLFSDVFFTRDSHIFVEYLLNHQSGNIWMFRFSFLGSLNGPLMKDLGLKGACHSDQLAYQFYRPQKKNVNLTEDDRRIIRFFSESWTNFAKHSNPATPAAGVDWLALNKSDKYCLDVDNELRLLSHPDRQRVEFWQHIYKKYGEEKAKL